MTIVRDLVGRLRCGAPTPDFDAAGCSHCGTLVINPDGAACPQCERGELRPVEP